MIGHKSVLKDLAGQIQDFWKRVYIRAWGFTLYLFISFFLNIPLKLNNLVSLRQNYFIFIGFLKTGGGGGGGEGGGRWVRTTPLWNHLI